MSTSQSGPREFSAAEATQEFAQGLPGKRVQFFDGSTAERVMNVTGVLLTGGSVSAEYQLTGRFENPPEGADPRASTVTITPAIRVRILDAAEVPVEPGTVE